MYFNKNKINKLISFSLLFSSNFVFSSQNIQPLSTTYDKAVIQDIAEFAELVHRIRYFYPSETNNATQWEYFLKYSISEILKLPTEDRLEHGLILLKSVTPLIEREKSKLPELKESEQLYHWINFGPRQYNFFFRVILKSDPQYIPAPNALVYSDWYNGQELHWPLFSRKQDLHLGKVHHSIDGPVSLEDPATCMAAVSSIWGEIHHFWPYFEQVSVDWESSHVELLNGCLGDIDKLEQVIRTEFTKLQDNHVWVGLPREYRESNFYRLPLDIDHIEGKAIVTNKTSYLTLQAEIGDELISIDGTPTDKLIENYKNQTLKSVHRAETMATRMLPRLYNAPQLVDLEFKKPDGRVITTSTASIHDNVIGPFNRPAKDGSVIQQLGDGIIVFRPHKLSNHDALQTAKLALADSHGVILDMRGYPSNLMLTNQALGMFTDNPLKLGEFSFFIQLLPNREQAFKAEQLSPTPATPQLFNVPIVAMAGRNNQSAGEHMMQWVQSMGIPIVGEVTAGINGEHVHAQLFGGHANGGISFRYTGSLSNQFDGSKLIGVGIQPDILTPITQESIQQNRDIQMQAAITQLKRMMQH